MTGEISLSAVTDLVIARRALQEADSLPTVAKLVDGAEAMKILAKKVGLSRDAQNDWAEYKLDAERKAGVMLAAMGERRGRPKRLHDVTFNADLGISKLQSHRWKQVASLPEDQYEGYKSDTRSKGKEITEAGVLAKAKHHQRETTKKETAKQVAEIMPEAATIALAACEDWLPSQPDCDLLLTDPPYSTDVVNVDKFAHRWLPAALDKVKPTGRAYVCIGAYPDELRAYLNIAAPEHLTLANVLVWTYRNTLGPSPTLDYKLNWQAILYYRGVDAEPLDCPEMVEQFTVQDINAPDGRQGDRWHAWQKPDLLAERFIRHSTKPGDLMLDPFACTGTFLLAAARLGRKASGCEISEEHLQIAVERGCARA